MKSIDTRQGTYLSLLLLLLRQRLCNELAVAGLMRVDPINAGCDTSGCALGRDFLLHFDTLSGGLLASAGPSKALIYL